MENLNERQKEAVMTTEGPLLIVAGAGAGKTKTIVERIIYLLEKGVSAENILGITFTNKAASEMRERVLAKIKNGQSPVLKTFHSLAVRIIRENSESINLNKNFSILDDVESKKRIRDAIKELGFDPKEVGVDKIRGKISNSKQELLTPDALLEGARNDSEKLTSLVWKNYEVSCREDAVLDFDDLLLECYKILSIPKIRNLYHQKFEYIHVDEYQDTNNLEYNIVKLLVGPKKNICVVGDADQNIYGWRGANIQNILRFEQDWPEAKIIFLEQNYRSTKTILELANKAIEKNTLRIPKNLTTENENGEMATYALLPNETAEAFYVAQKCQEFIAQGVRPEDIAVLYRANFQSRSLEEIMIAENIPYTVLGVRFFERKEIKDLISYLRASFDSSVLGEIKRIINTPSRGIGKVAMTKIFSNQFENLPPKTQIAVTEFYKILKDIKKFLEKNPPSEVIKYAIERSGLYANFKNEGDEGQERIENMEELISLGRRFDHLEKPNGMLAFLDEVSLHSDQDDLDEKDKSNGVRLMTIHASKGLEFENVFIVGLEEGLFPHQRIYETKKIEDAEEERRLFYVALTRAKKKIFLTSANIRIVHGNIERRFPSEFLSDLPSEFLKSENDANFNNDKDEIFIT